MRIQWSKMKTLINVSVFRNDKFLSLIIDKGVLQNANDNTISSLNSDNSQNFRINFFELLHHGNSGDKKILQFSSVSNRFSAIGIFIKYVNWLPVKLKINLMDDGAGEKNIFYSTKNRKK